MNKLDFSNRELLDKYYKEKFTFDLSNYFVVNGWKKLDYSRKYKVSEDTFVLNLHTRGQYTFDGDPAIYLGCGPWWNTPQNFEFSGIFAFLYLATKCIRKHEGGEKALLFCQQYCFPIFGDEQTKEDFDVVATLKEAMIAPCRAESENYVDMLHMVIPYMQEQIQGFLEQCCPKVQNELDERLSDFMDWVVNTRDEMVSFYGMPFRKEYMPEGCPYPVKYFQLKSWKWFSNRYKVYSYNDIPRLKLGRWPFTFSDIIKFDGPIVPHFDDLGFMREMERKMNDSVSEDDFFSPCKLSREEKNENLLYNVIQNLLWDDEPFTRKGKSGLKDCWGRVIVPAEFEACEGIHQGHYIHHNKICVMVKKDGKWALLKRKNYRELMTFYRFDEINLLFQGFYAVRCNDKYGLYDQYGREIIPARMDDIYDPTVCEHNIMYKDNGKYGVLYHNGTKTQVLADDIDLDSGYRLSVKVNGKWGYYAADGGFTTKRENAYLLRNGFNLNSMVKHKFGFPMDFDPEHPNLDGYITMDELKDHLAKNFWRFSERVDFRESCLQGKAKVKMGLDKKVLFYTILPDGPTFCVDMERPYLLKLHDDRYHDMIQSWDGYEQEKEMLKQWLNEPNRKTGVRNWAECIYERNLIPRNEGKPLVVSYAYRKTFDISSLSYSDFEHYNFPEIEFKS
jgi:hypothetical protein